MLTLLQIPLRILVKSSPSSVCRSLEGKASNNGQEVAKTRSQERREYLLRQETQVIHFISVAFPNFPSHILTELTPASTAFGDYLYE